MFTSLHASQADVRNVDESSINEHTLEQENESELSKERERARMLQEELMKARGDKAVSSEVCGCVGDSASDCICAKCGRNRTHACILVH